MASKHSLSAETTTPLEADNFKLINGIGRAVEQRLHSAGILTYAQLGALSPDDIAGLVVGLAGLSAERIAKQDWIGQARELAAGSPLLEVRHDTIAPADRQHYATFTVELLLDEGNDVRRTRVAHVQGGAEESWAGWRATQLLEFFTQSAQIQAAPVEQLPSAQEETPGVEEAPSVADAGRDAQANISGLALVPVGADGSRSFLRDDELFEVQLDFAFSNVLTAAEESLVYSATIYAKNLLDRSRHIISQARDTIAQADSTSVRLAGARLPHGIYRLEAVLNVKQPAGESDAANEQTAFWEGGLIQVY